MPIPFADNFLAGSLISLLFPVLLLIALVTWYLIAVKHVGRGGADQPQAATAGEQSATGSATAQGGQVSAATAAPASAVTAGASAVEATPAAPSAAATHGGPAVAGDEQSATNAERGAETEQGADADQGAAGD